jgi:hypothetical protein
VQKSSLNSGLINPDARFLQPRRPNVIILTSGITGSSILAGFLARSGYWAGHTTVKKEYDTFENAELVRLNQQIFRQAGYAGNYIKEVSTDAIARIASMHGECNDFLYREFVRKCAEHRPWIWKDPRLWLTIYFWRHIVNMDECRFILLTRDLVQAWVSGTLRRDIRSYDSLKQYETSIKNSILSFLRGNRLPYLHITYENLVARPDQTIRQLNRHLEADLTMSDLEGVYQGPLHRSPRKSVADFAKAVLIYLRHYPERLDAAEADTGPTAI